MVSASVDASGVSLARPSRPRRRDQDTARQVGAPGQQVEADQDVPGRADQLIVLVHVLRLHLKAQRRGLLFELDRYDRPTKAGHQRLETTKARVRRRARRIKGGDGE